MWQACVLIAGVATIIVRVEKILLIVLLTVVLVLLLVVATPNVKIGLGKIPILVVMIVAAVATGL